MWKFMDKNRRRKKQRKINWIEFFYGNFPVFQQIFKKTDWKLNEMKIFSADLVNFSFLTFRTIPFRLAQTHFHFRVYFHVAIRN